MKAVLGGIIGAFLIVAAFLGGAHWNDLAKSRPENLPRFEMHVSADGTVIRMDRVTGQLHMVTASGASDCPGTFCRAGGDTETVKEKTSNAQTPWVDVKRQKNIKLGVGR
jgi:hypothetical protein